MLPGIYSGPYYSPYVGERTIDSSSDVPGGGLIAYSLFCCFVMGWRFYGNTVGRQNRGAQYMRRGKHATLGVRTEPNIQFSVLALTCIDVYISIYI